jgi:nicotinamidase-related amidase
MPITQIDPKTALIVVDLQKGIVSLPIVQSVDKIVQHSLQLIDTFHQENLPVVLVNVEGRAAGRNELPVSDATKPVGWCQLIDEIEVQKGDIRITKHTWGAFHNTDLHATLQKWGVTQVVIVGLATSMGVESTARQASELGYHIITVVDAVGDTDELAHHNSCTRIFPKIAECGFTQEVIDIIQAKG